MSSIQLRNVVKRFGSTQVVHGIDLDIDEGHDVASALHTHVVGVGFVTEELVKALKDCRGPTTVEATISSLNPFDQPGRRFAVQLFA